MKTIAVVLLVAIGCQLISAEFPNNFQGDVIRDSVSRALGDRIKSILEDLKQLMKNGNSSLGIPVLDPLAMANQQINIEEDQVAVQGEVSDFSVEGLSDYVVQNVDLKFGTWIFSIDLLWNSIDAKTLYQLEGFLLNKVPFYGAGDFGLNVDGFNFATQAKLKIDYKTKKISVASFTNTKILVEKLMFHVSGLFNDETISEFVSALVTDIGAQTLKDFQKEITALVNEVLLETANELLEDINLDDILGMVQYIN